MHTGTKEAQPQQARMKVGRQRSEQEEEAATTGEAQV